MKTFNIMNRGFIYLTWLCLTLVTTNLPAQLPKGVVDTQPGTELPPSPEKSLELITVPENFQVSLFAGEPDVAQPIAIEYDDRGRLWVLESFSYIEWKRTGKDRLLIFEDTNNDGKFDSRKVFWYRGNHSSGFQIGFGGVWLCDAPELLFIPDRNRDDIPDGEPEAVLDGWSTKAEHNFFNGLSWGPDGWLYGRHGIKAPSKVGKPGAPDNQRVDLSCCIWRYHPVKETFEVWADGTVNPWGLDWNEEGEGFINTSVLDHFWHLVPGARFQRSSGREAGIRDSYSYELMEPTSDHRHWTGGQTGRKDFGGNDDSGGGHSHSGLVIYQSNSWPEKYRGQALFSNVLGSRINMDRLERSGSAWIASHGEDFLRSDSAWFRAIDLKQGPYGELMFSEWTDLGECHDRDGVHRSSGRVYEVWYGQRPQRINFDVSSMSTEALWTLLFHENVWWRRHALRNLHERIANGETVKSFQIKILIDKANNSPLRDAISAVQALHALKLPEEKWFPIVYESALASDRSEELAPLRVHLITLLFTEEVPSAKWIEWFEKAISKERSLSVLYRMAALLQRIPIEDRWAAAETLAEVSVPKTDRNFSLMRWYGFEPLVETDPKRAMQVAISNSDTWLSSSITRRLTANESLPTVLSALKAKGIQAQTLKAVLNGLLEALPGRIEMPQGWEALYPELQQLSDSELKRKAFALALRFSDPDAEQEMVEYVLNDATHIQVRVDYLQMLVSARSKKIAEHIPKLIVVPELANTAIRAEAIFPSPESAERLLDLLNNKVNSKSTDRSRAIFETLVTRKEFADALVAAVLDGRIPKDSVPAYISRQVVQVSSNADVFANHLGLDYKELKNKTNLLETWKKRLSEKYLTSANPVEGREVFRKNCATCHKLYGQGSDIGPDLTGSGRANRDYFLINVLFPSEDVAPNFRLTTFALEDGRVLSGLIKEENTNVISLQQVGKVERINAADVVTRRTSDISMMPQGVLEKLRREDIRDLIGYLRTQRALPGQ
ncbi:c-type cytochrome [bacterium]|nr:c-type cytochrome [bacterium]